MKLEIKYKGKVVEVDERSFKDQTSNGFNWKGKTVHKKKNGSQTPGHTKAHIRPIINNYLFKYCAKYSRARKHSSYPSIKNSSYWNSK